MLKKVLKLFVNFFTFVVFGILVIVICGKVSMLINKTDYFKLFGYSFFNVSTGSMEPYLKQNDIIVIKEGKEYKENDVVTYRMEDSYVTHRIISIDGDNIITKGDNNNTFDKVIDKSLIIGVLVKVLPGAGIWQKVFTTPSIIVTIFITLILFDFAFSYKGIKKKSLKKKVSKVDNVSLEQVNKSNDEIKLNDNEIKVLYDKIDKIKNDEDIKLDKKENDFLNYTIGLDLNEIRKRIDENINKE